MCNVYDWLTHVIGSLGSAPRILTYRIVFTSFYLHLVIIHFLSSECQNHTILIRCKISNCLRV